MSDQTAGDVRAASSTQPGAATSAGERREETSAPSRLTKQQKGRSHCQYCLHGGGLDRRGIGFCYLVSQPAAIETDTRWGGEISTCCRREPATIGGRAVTFRCHRKSASGGRETVDSGERDISCGRGHGQCPQTA